MSRAGGRMVLRQSARRDQQQGHKPTPSRQMANRGERAACPVACRDGAIEVIHFAARRTLSPQRACQTLGNRSADGGVSIIVDVAEIPEQRSRVVGENLRQIDKAASTVAAILSL